MHRLALAALLILLAAGCGGDDPVSPETEPLFGRWVTFSPRFAGDVVVAPPTGSLGRTEREYIYQMRHDIWADHDGDTVTITDSQRLSGPETDRVYNRDGSLHSRKTGDIVTTASGFWSRSYTGTFPGGTGEFVALDEDGHALRVRVTADRLHLEFENHEKLFTPFVRTFYDYAEGPPESTPLRDHFLADPYVLEFDR